MKKAEALRTITEYVEMHLDEKLDLDRIAAALHYSKYYLHRMFRSATGMTIHDYVQRRQITEAAKLLAFSDRPIVEIAAVAGFESQQAFSNTFRAMYKKSPHQFRMSESYYPLQLAFPAEAYIVEHAQEEDEAGEIMPAAETDIPEWMELLKQVVDGFPNLIEADHECVLHTYIENGQAWIIREQGRVIGSMLVSGNSGTIDFLAVHPLYRQQGVARQLLDKALEELLEHEQVCITTYREGDRADTGHRRAVQALGFSEGELLTEFGYPTQKMILKKEGYFQNE